MASSELNGAETARPSQTREPTATISDVIHGAEGCERSTIRERISRAYIRST